jgi:excisionase family DNA binding protein
MPDSWSFSTPRAKDVRVSDRWLSVEEIAAHLGVSRDTVYTWVNEKGMPAHKVGKLWKFKISEVDDWVRTGVSARPRTVSHKESE